MFKNINQKHFYNLFFILLLFYLICDMTKQIDVEAFAEGQEIILIGDSVLNNSNYVEKGKTVFDNIEKQHEKVLLLAKDHAIVEDLLRQFSEMHEHLNIISTTIFISIGGNDILHYNPMSGINENRFIDLLFNDYINIINQLYNEWNLKARIVFCTIYFPQKEEYKQYYNMIKRWNTKLREYANEHEHNVLELDKILNKDEYFVHSIEPSEKGSKVIADKILKYN